MKNRDQIDTAAWEFFWKRTKKEVNDEGTRPDMVIGYREGYEQAIRDIEETSPQDVPAICEYSGLRPVEGYKEDKETYRIDEEKIDSLMDTLHKIDETPEEKAYRMGWLNGYDEGANDKETDTKKGDRDFMYKWIREKSGK